MAKKVVPKQIINLPDISDEPYEKLQVTTQRRLSLKGDQIHLDVTYELLPFGDHEPEPISPECYKVSVDSLIDFFKKKGK